MNNLQKYNNAFIESFEVEENELNADFTFDKIEKWNSVAHMTLINILEDTFGIMFDTEDILNYVSYENGKKILAKYGVKF